MTSTSSNSSQEGEGHHRIVKFGKYKGKPISKLLEDEKYVKWIRVQKWFDEKNSWVKRAVRSRPPPPKAVKSTPAVDNKKKKQMTLDSFFAG